MKRSALVMLISLLFIIGMTNVWGQIREERRNEKDSIAADRSDRWYHERRHDRKERHHRRDEPRDLVMCTDAGCKFFRQMVPTGHQHWYRCVDGTCRDFNQYVPPGHQHWHRCLDVACRSFNLFVPPDHLHVH